jgi:hypothetical protein
MRRSAGSDGRQALLALFLAVASPTCENETNESCSISCAQLERCDLLPSPLGSDVDNCTARCSNSTDDVRTNFEACARRARSSQVWTIAANERSGCNAVAACLSAAAQSTSIVGKGKAAIIADLRPLEPTASAFDGAVSPLLARLACEPLLDQATAASRCEALSAFSVEVFVEQGAERFAFEDVCATALSMVAFDGLSAGLARGGYVVQGAELVTTLDAGPDGSADDAGPPEQETRPFCYVLRSSVAVVPAGGCAGLGVHVPDELSSLRAAGSPCERDADSCNDSIDNDEDGRVDCLDTECAAFCPKDTTVTSFSSLCPADAGCLPSTDDGL